MSPVFTVVLSQTKWGEEQRSNANKLFIMFHEACKKLLIVSALSVNVIFIVLFPAKTDIEDINEPCSGD